MTDFYQKALTAEQRIRPFIKTTPLDYSIPLSTLTGSEVYLKCECLQHTGSFKVRGAMNKLLSLSSAQKQQGVVAASTGNHGASVAYALQKLKISGDIFVPENASSTKIANILNYDVPIHYHATDCMQTEMYARDYADKHKMIYVSPYNDVDIICGQGTLAHELTQQLDAIDIILVPVGGGGLISGIASYIKSASPKTAVIGCLPENSPVMAASIKAGKIIDMPTLPTISDATAGGIEPNSLTFDLCQKYVDDYILVSEDEIKKAIITVLQTHHLLVEAAAGVAVAALMKTASQWQNKNVVVILSGANISLATLKAIL